MNLLEASKQHISWMNDPIGKNAHRSRTDMMNELTVTDTPHRSDEPNLWNVEIIKDYARRFSFSPG